MTEDQKKRIFLYQVLGQHKFEADSMLALNKVLQKTRKETRFFKVQYSLSGVVFLLLIKNANTKLIVPCLSNVSI